MSGADWLALFLQCCGLSLLTIGGYATVLPDLHRQLVVERGWLGDAAFAQGVALGQVVPGPNILVVGVLGYLGAGWMGLTACLAGILLPSSLLVWRASRWVREQRERGAELELERLLRQPRRELQLLLLFVQAPKCGKLISIQLEGDLFADGMPHKAAIDAVDIEHFLLERQDASHVARHGLELEDAVVLPGPKLRADVA